jgi:tetratricopeptide (TPR) repeat protein
MTISTKTSTNHRGGIVARTACTAALALSMAAGLAACGGGKHGKYTGDFKAERESAKAVLKAATAYDMAHQAYLAGDLDKALKQIDNSIALNDEVVKSHLLRGRILQEMSDFQGALQALAAAIELDDQCHEAHYFQGIIYERIADQPNAVTAYMEAAEIAPSNPQYAIAVAEVLIDLNRIPEAQQFLEREGSSYQHSAGVAQTLGHIALMQDDARAAVEYFEKARLLAPENQDIMEDLVGAQMAVGKFAEAEYTLTQLLAIEGNETRRDLLHQKARCLLAVDRPVEARDVLLVLTGDDAGQSDVDAWVELGNVAYKLGDMARLRTASARVVALAPDRFEGYLLRGLWERRQGQPARALKSLSRAVQLREGDVTPLIVMGIVQRELGDNAAARQSLELASSEQPGNQTVQGFLRLMDQGPDRRISAPRRTTVATHPEGDQ